MPGFQNGRVFCLTFQTSSLSSPQVKSGRMGAVSHPSSQQTGFNFHTCRCSYGRRLRKRHMASTDFRLLGISKSLWALGKNQWIALNWLPLLYAQVQILSCRIRKSDPTCAYHFYLMFLLWALVQCSQSLSVFGYLTGKTKNILKFKTMASTKTVCEVFKLVVFFPFFKSFFLFYFLLWLKQILLFVWPTDWH